MRLLRNMIVKKYWSLLAVILIVSCSQEPPSVTNTPAAEEVAVNIVETAPPGTAISAETATPISLSEESVQPTAVIPETEEPTVTSTPTATVFPTATAVPPEWLTPAPHAPDIQQPPYRESECSDRFPCNEDVQAWEERIQVPDGFAAQYFSYLPNPDHPDRASQLTSLTFGPDGLLYVATTQGNIYAIDQDGEVSVYAEGLNVPTGIAFQPGTEKLFVSNRVLDRNVGGEGQVSIIENGQIQTLFDGLPCCYIGMHGPNGIAFGPDGYGYVGVGGRADHGEILDGSNEQDELHPLEATILRFNPNDGQLEPYAFGFRNPYDISWDADGRLFATDNGRDGDVPDELHIVEPGGQHGYPYFDCPACFGIPEDVELVDTWHEFPPHAVAAGLVTYLDNEFPGYFNSQFVTLWTALDFAQRVMRFLPDGSYSTFATGFAAPIDVTVGPDGALYVADYATGIIFKIVYSG